MRMRRGWILSAAVAAAWLALAPATAAAPAAAAGAGAQVKTREIEYKQGETPLHGFLAWNDAAKGKRPGVLVVHEWWGLNENTRNQAKRLAQSSYVAFALDLYGNGKAADPTHPKDAESFMAEAAKDPAALAARFKAALDLLKKDPHVDPEKIAAIGYCFGGGVVLNMARAGADLDAVVSFHGALNPTTPAPKGTIKPRILVLTGADDPMVTASVVDSFRKEMDAAGARYQVISYPGAKHAFTNPDAGKAGMDALAYDAEADKRSWAEMLKLFSSVFG
jgi:dienelactone hydrolase